MSDVKKAIDAVLRQEDSTLSGKVVDLKNGAGWTRFGITSRNHPELIQSGFFDASLVDRDQALVIAEQVYSDQYANPLRIAEITNQDLAAAVLSFGINSGIGRSAKNLQEACHELGLSVVCDGKIGPTTLAAVNRMNPRALFDEFSNLARAFYQNLAESNPADKAFLGVWLNRVKAWAG